MIKRTQLLAFAICALLPMSAMAQNNQAKSDKKFDEGARLYHSGEYAAAILELKEGYRLAPHPVFLVNISLAYARLENWTEASSFARRATTEQGLAAKPHAGTAARGDAWHTRGLADEVVGATLDARALAAAEAKKKSVVKTVEPPPKKRPGTLGWVGVATAGGGVAAIAAAVVIGATLEDDREAYEAAAAAGNRAEYDRLADVIDRNQTLGQVLLYSGAGLVAVGTGLFILDWTTERAAVGLGPSGARFVLRW